MARINIQRVYDDNARDLALTWVAGHEGGDRVLESDVAHKTRVALVGHLNLVHPNLIQVFGEEEIQYLTHPEAVGAVQSTAPQIIDRLFSNDLTAVIVASSQPVPDMLTEACELSGVPLFVSTEQSSHLTLVLSHYLAEALADSILLHGVFLDVLGIGVLLTGSSAIGKSELALELITRGHRLVADDMVEFYRLAPDTLEGRCPTLLQDFLEVRGLGILNIRYLFGETAIKQKKNLKLIVQLEELRDNRETADRLDVQESTETILGESIPKVRLPVAAGRNLAVLVEVAVRNHILHLRGLNSARQFMDRQQKQILESD